MRTRTRLLASALIAVLVATTTGCGLFDSTSPDDVVREFLAALAKGDTKRAGALTDSPEVARSALAQARGALEPKAISIAIGKVDEPSDSSSATVDYTLDWQLAPSRRWSYQAKAELFPTDDGWMMHWSPTLIHPELAPQQTLAMREDVPALAPILDRGGRKLLAPTNVVSIMLYPKEAKAGGGVGEVAAALSGSLRRFDSAITTKAIEAGAGEVKKDGSYLVAVLREADYLRVKAAIYDLPGVRFSKQERLLAPTKEFGAQVLPGIRTLVEKRVAGSAGWRVIVRDATGADSTELHAEEPKPSEALKTTLSYAAQSSAERALAGVGKPAAIVAMKASTGELLAVAQNAKANPQGAIALTGRYPPGSTFKIITAAAGLSSGRVKPDSKVDCPGTTVVGGRMVPNEDRFELGRVPLSTAFARSCNTTFAKLAAGLPADALTKAARDLGIGADFEIPAITTITGSAPSATNEVQRAENGFGQGKILASPFGMALVAATVAHGKTPTPSLLAGETTKAKDLGEPLPAGVLKALRAMMRKVVTAGTARALGGLADVRGKTGTAQFGDGKHSHGWFAGYQGDTAFAVLIVGGESSKPAVGVAREFLSGIG